MGEPSLVISIGSVGAMSTKIAGVNELTHLSWLVLTGCHEFYFPIHIGFGIIIPIDEYNPRGIPSRDPGLELSASRPLGRPLGGPVEVLSKSKTIVELKRRKPLKRSQKPDL